ncbi:retinoblastoma-binding protein 6 [Yaravirus sp. 'brasiliensis']|uniref:Retinoblastoma-binding protein 6 n=1 Tax=Yaravirus sp. 'brasiliensis' TaxID=2739681 RepID=A0AAE7B7E8_9VIRU|nr:retinoblastoma-binding protein 6 [Yaravirus brasiliensis]QKE44399.1 retinoblastoma-binding protein 6 [Yaravirus brasiliensis]
MTSLPLLPLYPPRYPPAGPTCQLCDATGHAARSCPTHLNQVSANRELEAKVLRLETDVKRHMARLAETEDQVRSITKDVQRMINEADKALEEHEGWSTSDEEEF